MKLYKASSQVREGAQPLFLKARTVPYALQEKVERELQRLDDKGVIYKVSGSDWAAPVALVPKKDGSLRVCGDYKTTVNPCADVDQYPLPIIEDLFATLSLSLSLSFSDTGLTRMAFVPSLRRWMHSCKPRVLPMSQS